MAPGRRSDCPDACRGSIAVLLENTIQFRRRQPPGGDGRIRALRSNRREPAMIGVTHDELARQQFVLALNRYVQTTLAEGSRRVCDDRGRAGARHRRRAGSARPPAPAPAHGGGAAAPLVALDDAGVAGPSLALHRASAWTGSSTISSRAAGRGRATAAPCASIPGSSCPPTRRRSTTTRSLAATTRRRGPTTCARARSTRSRARTTC